MAAGAIAVLSEANGIATLALQIGTLVVPIIKGVVTKIEQVSSGASSVDYQVLITSDGAELDGIAKVALADLAAINAELARLKQTQLPSPVPTPPPATT